MCCGNRPLSTSTPQPQTSSAAVSSTVSPVRQNRARFEYTGKTALTVVSPLTGKRYRFHEPGAQLEVDARDRSWIAFVPHLKRTA